MRAGLLQCVCIACALVLGACSGGSGPRLHQEFSTELRVDGQEPVGVTHALRAGVFLVEVRERDIDLRMTLEVGGKQLEFEDGVQRHGLHADVVRLDAPAPIKIAVRSSDHRDKRGVAVVTISSWPNPADQSTDETRLGFTEVGVAGRETATGSPEGWTRAAEALRRASAHFAIARNDPAYAQAEYSLGSLEYWLRTKWEPAIRAADAAGEAYENVDDELGWHRASVLRGSAELEVAAGMSAESQQAEQRALFASVDQRLAQAAKFFDEHGRQVDEAYAVNMRGLIYLIRSDRPRAEELFSEANRLARAIGDPTTLSNTLGNLAFMNSMRGEVVKAAKQYEDLLPLLDRERDPDRYATTIGNYAACLIALGEFDGALALHSEALEVFRSRGTDLDRGNQLNSLGALYMRVGDLERALATLRSAAELYQRIGNDSGRATALRMAGNASAALGDPRAALAYLRESLELDAKPQSVALTRMLIARQLRVSGDLAGAARELAASLTNENHLTRAHALAERAQLFRARRDYPAALADLRAADKLYAGLGLDFDRIDTTAAISQAMLAMGDVAGAGAAADLAIGLERRIRVKSANPEWRARFLSESYSPYEARIAADLAANRAGNEQGTWSSFRTADAVRARSLSDQLTSESRAAATDSDSVGDELRARLTALQIRLETRILRQDPDEGATNELRRTIEETRASIDAHDLKRQGARRLDPVAPELPASLAQVQNALPRDTGVLAYFVGDESSHAWLLTRSSLRHATLPGRTELRRTADAFVATLRGTNDQARLVDASRVSRTLLADLLEGATETRLLLIPDGPLNGVPFAALPMRADGTTMLVDHFVLGYAPSLTLALRTPARASSSQARVAVVSDPVYARDDGRLHLATADTSSYRGMRQPPGSFTRLPYSALEARAVSRAFGASDTIDISGFEATPPRILQLQSEKLAVLHFATHAVVRRDSPDESALFLSEFAADGTERATSRLTAGEIARSGLHADLVVLSGCATGDGSAIRGEGVLGLTYAFLANGSRSVVASLWPIQDASTARLMQEFYAAYRKTGRAGDALRVAQMHERNGAAWASFVVRANQFP